MVVRVALVLVTPARPARLLSYFLSSLTSAFTPIVFCFVGLGLFHIFVRPQTNRHSAYRLDGRRRNFFLAHPPMKSIGSDLQKLSNLNRRIGCPHLYIPIPYLICQGQNKITKHLAARALLTTILTITLSQVHLTNRTASAGEAALEVKPLTII
jgi:hypothetical protein